MMSAELLQLLTAIQILCLTSLISLGVSLLPGTKATAVSWKMPAGFSPASTMLTVGEKR